MKTKLYKSSDIILDGRMDEPVWKEVKEQTGFKEIAILGGSFNKRGGMLAEDQTFFKILPCEDCVYFGIKCMEPDMDFLKPKKLADIDMTDTVELFLAPTNEGSEFYHFLLSFHGETRTHFFAEHGNVTPRQYLPVWESAVYAGEDYWSAEIKLPLKMFFFTPNNRWNDTWLINLMRVQLKRPTARNAGKPRVISSWGALNKSVKEPEHFRHLEGFPMRRLRDEVCILPAGVELIKHTGSAYEGTMKVTIQNAVASQFVFASDHSQPITAMLEAGTNSITVPCSFGALGGQVVSLQLKRVSDGEVYQCRYKIAVEYEPIKIRFTLPEYRTNFYPGQDYTKIVGKVITSQPVTLKLEGPGIETTVITPNEDGSFAFETPNFEIGDATLTATIDGWELKKTIRRLAPTGHTMTWISGGNLMINGKPVVRRNMFAPYYRIGEAFKRRYERENLHETTLMTERSVQAPFLLPGSEGFGGEARRDGMPSEEMCRRIDKVIENNKDTDFGFYYIADEPEVRGVSTIYIKNCYRYVIEKDPYHVVVSAGLQADNNVETCDLYDVECYLYPIDTPEGRVHPHPIANLFDPAARMIHTQFRPDKCYGCMPNTYAQKPYADGRDYPSLEELICVTWAGIVRGSKSIWNYASHDLNDRPHLLEGTRYIFSTFEALEDLVTLGKRTVLTKSAEVEAAIFETDEEKMFALLNLSLKPQHVTLDGINGEWHEFRHNRTFSGNTFDLKPMEVLVGTSKVRDADLPTYEEVKELTDKLEYERTHGGSLLFNRFTDLELDASSPITGYKLFDGMRDNLAWSQRGEGDKFVELNLSKIAPTFQKIVVGGYRIQDMEVKIRNAGELTAPEVAEIRTEEFSTTVLLKEPVCPDALRLQFHQEYVELYEIEIF